MFIGGVPKQLIISGCGGFQRFTVLLPAANGCYDATAVTKGSAGGVSGWPRPPPSARYAGGGGGGGA